MKKKYKVSIRTIFLIIPGIILVIMLSVSLIALKQKSIPLSSGKAGQESSVIKPAMAMGPSQKARGYRNANMTLAQGQQQIPINTVSYDPSGIINTSNGRITPTMPGYYRVNGQTGAGLLGRLFSAIRKNGTEVARGSDITSLAGTEVWSPVSDIIYFNGTSDYIELWVYASWDTAVWAGPPTSTGGPSQLNYLSIVGPF